MKRPDQPIEGSLWEIPQSLYTPIAQQAVLLRDTAAARDFLGFVRSAEARQTMREFGYGAEDAE